LASEPRQKLKFQYLSTWPFQFALSWKPVLLAQFNTNLPEDSLFSWHHYFAELLLSFLLAPNSYSGRVGSRAIDRVFRNVHIYGTLVRLFLTDAAYHQRRGGAHKILWQIQLYDELRAGRNNKPGAEDNLLSNASSPVPGHCIINDGWQNAKGPLRSVVRVERTKSSWKSTKRDIHSHSALKARITQRSLWVSPPICTWPLAHRLEPVPKWV
jgi:hypothetical protein